MPQSNNMFDKLLSDLFGSCLGNKIQYQISKNAITIQSLCTTGNDATEVHSHSRGQLLCLISGNLIIVINNRSYVIYPGNYIWIPPNVKHRTSTRTFSELYSLYVNQDLSKSISADPCIMKASPLFIELLKRYSDLSQQATFNPDIVDNLVPLILMEINDSNKMPVGLPLPRDKRLLNLCKNLLDDPLCNKSLSELLTDMPISYRHAIRLFKAQTGIDFGKWRVFLRLHISVSLLISGLSVSQVSAEIGYSNPSGFSTAFKNKFGLSPKAYLNSGTQLNYTMQPKSLNGRQPAPLEHLS